MSPSCLARGGGLPRPRRVPTWLGGLAALAILAFGAASPPHAHAQVHDEPTCTHPQSTHEDSLEIIVHADRISLRAHDVPLCAVLMALAIETGLTVYGHIVDDQRISVQFERQRVTRVLDSLLGDSGYLLVLRDNTSEPRGALRALAPAGAPLAPAASSSADQSASPTATNPADRLTTEAAIIERRARLDAIESAADLDEAAAERVLASALADSDADMRAVAVESLAMLDTSNARELLHAAMQDSDPNVRLEVVDTLGDLEDLRSTLALERALADTDARVREAAAEYLAERN